MASPDQTIDVAVAVVINTAGEVLISYRHANLHQGNLWEFPGGKIERGESVQTALNRELREELGLEVQQSYPLKTIRYDYPDKSVRLHVRRVTAWEGEARGLEGQEVAWLPVAKLVPDEFPAANAPIIAALQLPALIAITPIVANVEELTSLLRQWIEQGLACIQLRQPQLTDADYLEWFQVAWKLCQGSRTLLLFNGDLSNFSTSSFTGYHATATRLQSWRCRPVPAATLFSASCHNLEELQHAAALNADFVFLSPVAATAKYPAGSALGWPAFAELVQQAGIPVYALGGLVQDDLVKARQCGASGISGIGMFLTGN